MQKKYKVRIREVLERDIEVICSSENEAVEIVEQEYRDGVHVLDASDFADGQSSIQAVINESSILDIFNSEFSMGLSSYEDLMFILNQDLNQFYVVTKDANIAFLQLDLKYKRFVSNYFTFKSVSAYFWHVRFKRPLNEEQLNILFNLFDTNSESTLLSVIYNKIKDSVEHLGVDPVNSLNQYIKDVKKLESIDSQIVSDLLDDCFEIIGFEPPFELVFDF